MKDSLEVAMVHFSKNKLVEAKALFNSILEKEPGNMKALYHLGVCEFRLKEFKAARKYFQDFVNIEPEEVNARYYLGLSYERQGHKEYAKKHFRVALKLDPSYKPAMKKLGVSEPKTRTPTQQNVTVKTNETVQEGVTDNPNEIFTFDKSNGPGELIYLSPHRRISSFSIRFCFISIVFVTFVFFGLTYALNIFSRSDEQVVAWILIVSAILLIVIGANLYLSSRFTEYKIYQRRVDIKVGFLFRKQISLWLFEITDIELTRSPLEVLTSNTTLNLCTEKGDISIRGLMRREGMNLGNTAFIQSLFEELRAVVREQRGEVKKVWI